MPKRRVADQVKAPIFNRSRRDEAKPKTHTSPSRSSNINKSARRAASKSPQKPRLVVPASLNSENRPDARTRTRPEVARPVQRLPKAPVPVPAAVIEISSGSSSDGSDCEIVSVAPRSVIAVKNELAAKVKMEACRASSAPSTPKSSARKPTTPDTPKSKRTLSRTVAYEKHQSWVDDDESDCVLQSVQLLTPTQQKRARSAVLRRFQKNTPTKRSVMPHYKSESLKAAPSCNFMQNTVDDDSDCVIEFVQETLTPPCRASSMKPRKFQGTTPKKYTAPVYKEGVLKNAAANDESKNAKDDDFAGVFESVKTASSPAEKGSRIQIEKGERATPLQKPKQSSHSASRNIQRSPGKTPMPTPVEHTAGRNEAVRVKSEHVRDEGTQTVPVRRNKAVTMIDLTGLPTDDSDSDGDILGEAVPRSLFPNASRVLFNMRRNVVKLEAGKIRLKEIEMEKEQLGDAVASFRENPAASIDSRDISGQAGTKRGTVVSSRTPNLTRPLPQVPMVNLRTPPPFRSIKPRLIRDGVSEHAVKPTVARLRKRIAKGEDFPHAVNDDSSSFAWKDLVTDGTETQASAMDAELRHRGIRNGMQYGNFWYNMMMEYSTLIGSPVPLFSMMKKGYDDFQAECLDVRRDLQPGYRPKTRGKVKDGSEKRLQGLEALMLWRAGETDESEASDGSSADTLRNERGRGGGAELRTDGWQSPTTARGRATASSEMAKTNTAVAEHGDLTEEFTGFDAVPKAVHQQQSMVEVIGKTPESKSPKSTTSAHKKRRLSDIGIPADKMTTDRVKRLKLLKQSKPGLGPRPGKPRPDKKRHDKNSDEVSYDHVLSRPRAIVKKKAKDGKAKGRAM
ncbi:hypothetical protein S40285_10061 [Stachybotrys chlorohalonatus IBT 40285]|uniref:Uncharacterized protein n=1 Tax=Stachybotrys chlorohalonatus (strain IBT 40285) TaxID=1283841 RepID=A0A084QMA9_STAC4|nr:hypothetical protein S40285_10061 [Stachybotrys chlorohalonata IBT 40285]